MKPYGLCGIFYFRRNGKTYTACTWGDGETERIFILPSEQSERLPERAQRVTPRASAASVSSSE